MTVSTTIKPLSVYAQIYILLIEPKAKINFNPKNPDYFSEKTDIIGL